MARNISNQPASCDSDWLNFIHFSGYMYKIRLVSKLRKREDQALISISTILKFLAQKSKKIEKTKIKINFFLTIQFSTTDF